MRRSVPLLAVVAAVTAGACRAASTPPVVTVTPDVSDAEGAALAVDPADPARVAAGYSAGRGAATGSCLVARSRDGGRAWESAIVAGGPSGSLPAGATHCADPAVAFARNGTLFVAYDASRPGGKGRIYLTSSTDHGATFAPAVAVDPAPSGGGDFEPALVATPALGGVSVSFERYADDFDSVVVMSARSSDGGRTLLPPTQVSRAGQNAVNARVAAAADRRGNVYVGWVDASDVDFDGSGDARIEVAASGDGGRSFEAPATIATVPSGCGANDDWQ